jgi:hypothetical protein
MFAAHSKFELSFSGDFTSLFPHTKMNGFPVILWLKYNGDVVLAVAPNTLSY